MALLVDSSMEGSVCRKFKSDSVNLLIMGEADLK
jgi:hypothetical protein